MLDFSLKFIDEGDNFAGEAGWSNGQPYYEIELAITHGLNEEMYGECYACRSENLDDEDYDSTRKAYGCDVERLGGLGIDLVVGEDN